MQNTFMFLASHGKVSSELLYLILLLPVIATLVAFLRQVIGLKLFGVYAPIVATYGFLEAGIGNGLIICTIIFLSAIILRKVTKSLKLHYLPRTSLLITFICIILLVLIPALTYLPFVNLVTIPPLSIILFLSLSDIYLTSEVKDGYKEAGRLYIETVIGAALLSLLISWSAFKSLLLAYPEIIIIFLILNIVIGRWTGLRVIEIYRFRSVIKEKAKEL